MQHVITLQHVYVKEVHWWSYPKRHHLMSLREQNKTFNRRKIIRAAEQIIRNEGIDKLSMRHLASRAGVSLRTPYNLFGSKTDVLLALLQEPFANMLSSMGKIETNSVLLLPFAMLDQLYVPIKEDESFFRGIYWSMMRSEHTETRDAGLKRAETMAAPLLLQAVMEGELDSQTDIPALGRHLVIIASALFGMWAGMQLSLEEVRAQVRLALASGLSRFTTDVGLRTLRSLNLEMYPPHAP